MYDNSVENIQIILLGDADEIVNYLCHMLGWTLPPPTSQSRLAPPVSRDFPSPPRRVCDSNIWLFTGADGGKYVEEVEANSSDHKKRVAEENRSDCETSLKKRRVQTEK